MYSELKEKPTGFEPHQPRKQGDLKMEQLEMEGEKIFRNERV